MVSENGGDILITKLLIVIASYVLRGLAYDVGHFFRSCNGVLTKTFKTPFRKREEWKFDAEDFEK